jgi:crotonobetaine/carnitine-CoA ligase
MTSRRRRAARSRSSSLREHPHARRRIEQRTRRPTLPPTLTRTTFDFSADYPFVQRTLGSVWRQRVDAHADEARFLWYPDRPALDIGELDRLITATAAGLQERGVRSGTHVCVLMRNSPEMLEVMIALWQLGAVVIPLSPQLEGQLLLEKIVEVAPLLTVVDAALADRLAEQVQAAHANGAAGAGYELVVNLASPPAAGPLPPHAGTLEELRRADAEPPSVEVDPTAPALILFTSGTSGRAKGCVISHHYAVYYSWVFWRHMRYEASDTLYTCLPLNHCHALFASFWPAVMAGARVAISERFSASRFWRDVADSEATGCTAIGTMTSILLAREPDEHESRAKVRVAHVSADGALDMPRFEKRFGCKAVTCLYGSTEVMVFPPLSEMPPIQGLIGPPPPDWDVALMDERENQLEGDATGELVVRPRIAHTMFERYHGRPDATAEAFRGLWFHTGDLARRDGSGMYWFKGRASDTIRRRGENVSAWEVERGIVEHHLVEEVAAFPLPSELSGSEVGVVVVRAGGSGLSVADLASHCESALPRYMRPDRIWVRDEELPKNAGGKADKARLREEYARTLTVDA